ncbi:glycosyl hydrolase [Terricaulis silvestris]|uniref:Sugar binding domain-containing glycosyl hydrolases family 2 n=1 Tax=Terricaulis silvestris TaxID=2686094 RepID=A0A6I6MT96_9CAUL|nr:glycosyl hydrolase [Terricaulis silvestris]QGZ94922.1 Sugar binding domain-containing glycosyl hydrolases family 2 [Terricaulis silvestris]
MAKSKSLTVHKIASPSSDTEDLLLRQFRHPPSEARPRVWWHWMNGNVSIEGVQHDFEWMKRVGIGGVHNFDASLQTPLIVDRHLPFLSEEWRRTLRDTVRMADRLGLEFTCASSPGWSTTGGPWVQAEQAMKKLVWSETEVEGQGGSTFALPHPADVAGPFGNAPATSSLSQTVRPVEAFYRDVAVLAFPTPRAERPIDVRGARTSDGATIDPAALSSEDLTQTFEFCARPGEPEAWIEIELSTRQTIQSASIGLTREKFEGFSDPPQATLQCGDDGEHFRHVTNIPIGFCPQTTVSFEPVAARFFRIVLAPSAKSMKAATASPKRRRIRRFVLLGASRLDQFEGKAGYAPYFDVDRPPVVVTCDSLIPKQEIIDLTGSQRRDGRIDWSPPPGRWTLLRIGYSLTGSLNHPASPSGTGLEVDKLNRDHVRSYIENYLGILRETIGADFIGSRGLTHMVNDSYEAGSANWTEDLLAKFEQARGYDMRPWLPTLTGRVVENSEASEAFLWDFRKTLSELIAEEHYGEIQRVLRAHGMRRYSESHEAWRAFVGDGMDVKKTADIPMSAAWQQPGLYPEAMHDIDIRESASVAHIYGQNLVAAESFTAQAISDPNAAYSFAPETLKPLADRMMAHGVNQFVIHTSVHQPQAEIGPGLTLGPFGQWFTRKETWAELAGAWIDYLARSSHLLRQGVFVADIAVLYGEDTNLTNRFARAGPILPKGFAYDFVNASALISEISAANARAVTPSGMHYAAILIDASASRMSLALLRKLAELADAGVLIAGVLPKCASLGDDQERFADLAATTWSRPNVETLADFETALSQQASPDVVFTPQDSTEHVQFVHRALPNEDIYFVRSSCAHALSVEASFRVAGRAAEIWRADTGKATPANYRRHEGRTIVPLEMEPYDAFFVLFRHATTETEFQTRAPACAEIANLDGPWDLEFESGRGATERLKFDQLQCLTEIDDPGVRYFSGQVVYSCRVDLTLPSDARRLELDLGVVKNVAEIVINGHPVATVWKPPFRADITDALQQGINHVQIRVANLWRNRLIGDKQPGASVVAFTTFNPCQADAPLSASGLLGPVRIVEVCLEPGARVRE